MMLKEEIVVKKFVEWRGYREDLEREERRIMGRKVKVEGDV